MTPKKRLLEWARLFMIEIARIPKFLGEWMNSILHSPFAFQFSTLVLLVFFFFSFRPSYFLELSEPFGQNTTVIGGQEIILRESGFLDNYAYVQTAGFEEVLVEDENGETVVQMMPKKRTEIAEYVVKPGDNISKIAHKFGLKVSTLLWANQLTSRETLQINQTIIVPPTDGIYYEVKDRDTLSELVKTFEVEMEKVLAYNSLDSNRTIKVGQRIFLPDAQKQFIPPRVVSERPVVATTGGAPSRPASTGSATVGSIGFKLLRPTKGTLTQGYHGGHYAIDIGNVPNTPIYASADGVVITSKDGWNYGYGSYIIIDHGNGVQTLYGHMNSRELQVGATVSKGQLIGRMGNSGRVFGPTGVHLHFELRINERKVNPNNYF